MATHSPFPASSAELISGKDVMQGFGQGGKPISRRRNSATSSIKLVRPTQHKGLIWQPNAETLAEFRLY